MKEKKELKMSTGSQIKYRLILAFLLTISDEQGIIRKRKKELASLLIGAKLAQTYVEVGRTIKWLINNHYCRYFKVSLFEDDKWNIRLGSHYCLQLINLKSFMQELIEIPRLPNANLESLKNKTLFINYNQIKEDVNDA